MGSVKAIAVKAAFVVAVLVAVKFIKGANIPVVSSTLNTFA